MQISCSCGKTLQVGDHLAGKKVKCPCGTILQVPGAAPAAAAKPAVRPATSGAVAARPTNTKPAAPTTSQAAFGLGQNEVSSLFDELTAGDMVTKKKSVEGDGHGKKKVDPLAAFRDESTSKRGRAKPSASASSKSPDSVTSKTVRNVRAICMLYVFFGSLNVLAGLGLMFMLPAEQAAKLPFPVMVFGVIAVVGAMSIVVALGGFARKSWGIIGCQVLSALYVFSFPIGTILGIYFLMNVKTYKESL